MRRLLIALVMVTSLLAAPATASPPDQAADRAPGTPPGLTDGNHDGLSDGLAATLAEMARHDRLDVVVTWTGPTNVAAA